MQLWAEVYLWYQEAPNAFRLTSEERRQLDKSNQVYREQLPGEEEILQAFNWELPFEEWGTFSATEVRMQVLGAERFSLQQIGRALAKIAWEDERVMMIHSKKFHRKDYRLPLRQVVINGV